jgi:hypothetical protein
MFSALVFERMNERLVALITIADCQLAEAGWLGRDALLMTGINALIYIASTIPTYAIISSVCLKFNTNPAVDGFL